MSVSLIHDAVETQRRELDRSLAERYVPRALARPLRDGRLITVISGPRRCGKPFDLGYPLQERPHGGKVHRPPGGGIPVLLAAALLLQGAGASRRQPQVCWDLSGKSTQQREIRALLQAGRDLSCDRLLVLTADTDAEEEVEWYGARGRLRLLPVWRWLVDAAGAAASQRITCLP